METIAQKAVAHHNLSHSSPTPPHPKLVKVHPSPFTPTKPFLSMNLHALDDIGTLLQPFTGMASLVRTSTTAAAASAASPSTPLGLSSPLASRVLGRFHVMSPPLLDRPASATGSNHELSPSRSETASPGRPSPGLSTIRSAIPPPPILDATASVRAKGNIALPPPPPPDSLSTFLATASLRLRSSVASSRDDISASTGSLTPLAGTIPARHLVDIQQASPVSPPPATRSVPPAPPVLPLPLPVDEFGSTSSLSRALGNALRNKQARTTAAQSMMSTSQSSEVLASPPPPPPPAHLSRHASGPTNNDSSAVSPPPPPPPPLMMIMGGDNNFNQPDFGVHLPPPPPPPPGMAKDVNAGTPLPPPPPPGITKGGNAGPPPPPPPPPPGMTKGVNASAAHDSPQDSANNAGGGGDLQNALKNALNKRATKPAEGNTSDTSPTTSQSGGPVSMQDELRGILSGGVKLKKRLDTSPDRPSPPSAASTLVPAENFQEQLKMRLQSRHSATNTVGIPHKDLSPNRNSAPEWQSQLKGKLATRLPSNDNVNMDNTTPESPDSLPSREQTSPQRNALLRPATGLTSRKASGLSHESHKDSANEPTTSSTSAPPSPAKKVSGSGTVRLKAKSAASSPSRNSEAPIAANRPAQLYGSTNMAMGMDAGATGGEDVGAVEGGGAAGGEGLQQQKAGELVVALADYEATGDGQLQLMAGETVRVLVWEYGNGWSYGEFLDGSRRGVFPQTYVDAL
ncbi:hypothetical protein SeMB42_g07674 [Synchytrium endobioticum]|uniref:SH3 domain-containing protein n=1 Tax=Synchytrium endobioticum TaxID=286115 RepID=A0A507BXV1_9FUNG|nr:hypothetical protein SeMB42_g07674 [Synchytrium endobioticum]